MSNNSKSFGLLSTVVSSIAVALIFTLPVFAQLSTGKLEGTVRDKDSGQPLAGAQVVVEGTQLGNVTNADGYYFILNVPPGRRDITFTFTGYQKTTVANQLILAGQTTTINANLSSTVVQLEGITIEGEAEPLIPRDQTVSKQRLTAEALTQTPATEMNDLLVLEAGVQIGGEGGMARGVRIRGGRLGEEAMVVDGIIVRNYTANPFRSGASWVWEQELGSRGEDTTPLEFSTGSVEEVDIVTGGFQAEYGNAQSGLINIVTKEGGPDLRGRVRMTSDELNPRTADYGYNQLQADIGGPVFGIPNLFFHVSGEIQGKADNNPTHADEGFRGINQDFVDRLNDAVRNDQILGTQLPVYTLEMFETGQKFFADNTGEEPVGVFTPKNPVRQPNNWGDRTLTSGKLTFSPRKGLKFLGTANFSRIQRSWPTDYFNYGAVDSDMLPKRGWDTAKGDWQDANGMWHAIVPINLGRRTRTTNLLLGADYDFYRSSQRNASLQFRFSNFRTQDINNADLKDNYVRENTFMSWSSHDIPFLVETFPGRTTPQDPEGARKYLPDGATAYSIGDYFYATPFYYVGPAQLYYLYYGYQYEKQYNYKADLDFQWNRENRAKLGFQMTDFKNRMFTIASSSLIRDLDNEFNYAPQQIAFYAQNRTDLGDFVLDYGIRWDQFRPKDNWGLRSGDTWEERFFPKNISEWSPRFDVAFPVTDKAQLRFAYGVFTQLPSLTFIFSGSNPGGLEYSRTDAFEAGLSYLLSNDVVMDMVAYYRDVDGNLATKEFFQNYYQWHSERLIRGWTTGYTNKDNGNIKGMDLTVKKRFSNNFSLNAMYTLQFSRTTGSQYNSYSDWWTFLDPATGEHFTPPDEIRPINGDVTHAMTVFFNYLFPEDFQTGTLANTILKNFRVYTVLRLSSGAPLGDRIQNNYVEYNWLTAVQWQTRRGGTPIGGLNYFRGRWYMDIMLRLSKTFTLGGSKRVSVFSEIFNLHNRKNPVEYPSGYTYEGYRYGWTGGVDLNWDDPTLARKQKWLFHSDFNGDGVLSVRESALGSIANSFMGGTTDWEAWGIARQIRAGVEFTF
ncbi:MAG TPA: TonB-dependent receptor [archaeon]|nr:TonB-dependent receptor [archaeon]